MKLISSDHSFADYLSLTNEFFNKNRTIASFIVLTFILILFSITFFLYVFVKLIFCNACSSAHNNKNSSKRKSYKKANDENNKTNKKNDTFVYFIHGFKGCGSNSFFPFLHVKAVENGWEFTSPDLPFTKQPPPYELWRDFIKNEYNFKKRICPIHNSANNTNNTKNVNNKRNSNADNNKANDNGKDDKVSINYEDTKIFFVAHSLGGYVTMRFLVESMNEEWFKKVKGVFLVSPFTSPKIFGGDDAEGFPEIEWQKIVEMKHVHFRLLYALGDEMLQKDHFDLMKDKLKAKEDMFKFFELDHVDCKSSHFAGPDHFNVPEIEKEVIEFINEVSTNN